MSDSDSGAPAPSRITLVPKQTGPVPAHAIDPRLNENARRHASVTVAVNREALFDVLEQLKQLAPCHKDPHRYHERKDELVSRIYHMAVAP